MMHSSWWEAYFAKHNVVNVAYQNGIISHQFEKKKQKKQFQDVPPATEIVKLNQVNDSATVNPQTLLPQCEHILQ